MACAHCSGQSAGIRSTSYPAAASAARGPICDAVVEGCECGGLETNCRPRWVAGMVIQETDLNRLDAYMLSKQRLHNRFLHGAGVVCGLVVTCHPCGEGVVRVSGGYAIGPCGEDIVVPANDAVDVCALIRQCRALERRAVECRPWGDDRGCDDLKEQWILAIRYDEQPSRDAPLLKAGARDCGCGGSCGCGGGCGGSCGCGGHGAKAKPSRREVPVSCAPTVTCETYRYEVFRAPTHPPCRTAAVGHGDDDIQVVSVVGRRRVSSLQACLQAIFALTSSRPSAELNDRIDDRGKREWNAFCLRLKATLRDHLLEAGTTACALVESLCSIPCPDPNLRPREFVDAMNRVLQQIWPIMLAALRDCLCLSILPPCPAPAQDPRVPLALITVDGGADCRVAEICNWTPLRPIVFTFPTIVHWLELFNLMSRVREFFFRLCCCLPEQRVATPQDERLRRAQPRSRRSRAAEPAVEAEVSESSKTFDVFSLSGLDRTLSTALEDPDGLFRMARDLTGFGPPPDLARRLAALEAEVAELRRGQNK